MSLAMSPDIMGDMLGEAFGAAISKALEPLVTELAVQRKVLEDMAEVQTTLHAVIEKARTANGFIAKLLGG